MNSVDSNHTCLCYLIQVNADDSAILDATVPSKSLIEE